MFDGAEATMHITANRIAPVDRQVLALAHAEDLIEVSVSTPEEAQLELRSRAREERVFSLFLPLFDPELSEECRRMVAKEIEELLVEDPNAIGLASNRFYAAPFPLPDRLDKALSISGELDARKLTEFLKRLSRCQPQIGEVAEAWAEIPDSNFPAGIDREFARSRVVDSGWFRRLVGIRVKGRSVRSFPEKANEALEIGCLPESLKWLQAWTHGFFENEIEQRLEPEELAILRADVEAWKQGIMDLIPRDANLARQAAMRLKTLQLEKGHPRFAAMSLCDLASRCKAKGWYRSQLDMAELAVRVNPHDPQCHCLLGDAQKKNRQFEIAVLTYDATIAEFPDNIVARCGKAEVLRELGRPEEALRDYDETIAKFPDNVVARNGKAEVLRELGRPEDALRDYDETIAKFPDSVVAWCGKAEVLRELGRPEDALRDYNETIAKFPGDVVARCGKAEVLRELGRPEEALRDYDETIAKFPDSVVAWSGKAEVLRELGRPEDALGAYDETIAKFPDNMVAYQGKASILAILERFEEALELLPREPVTLDSWVGFHVRGMIHLKAGSFEKAIEVFDRGCNAALPSRHSRYYRTARGICHLLQGQQAKALEVIPETGGGELLNIIPLIRAHALGKDDQVEACSELITPLIAKTKSTLRNTAVEVKKRYVDGAPNHSEEWLFAREIELSLAA